ncbi:hypothetical protein GOL41_27010 [Sinorhizobium medicae]|nr:hypothetical protein [Sinorhizobium medicae]
MRYTEAFNSNVLDRRFLTSAPRDAAGFEATGAAEPQLDLALRPRDEAVFWLTAAAEIEHSLMVQYLFAAYSLDPTAVGQQSEKVSALKNKLLQIAREEMGHLITVQNLLLVIGGPLHVGRDHSPQAESIHPFRFKLERLTLGSLAKYVMAESPDVPLEEMTMLSDERKALLRDEIIEKARVNNDGRDVRHVGPIFARLVRLLGEELDDSDFRLDRLSHQARWSDWGYDAGHSDISSKTRGGYVLVEALDAGTVDAVRQQAVGALSAIGEQGEFVDSGDELDDSHFDRFLQLYEQLKSIETEVGHAVTWPVARFPNTTVASDPLDAMTMADAVLNSHLDEGRIVAERPRAWAHLFNLRYRVLLGCLLHGFHIAGPLYEEAGESTGDRSAKGLLNAWAFREMARLKKLSEKLVQMPLDDSGGNHAGPPFELPYTLQQSSFEADRWHVHADIFSASESLARGIQTRFQFDTDDPFLLHLIAEDAASSLIAREIAASGQVPPEAKPTGFRKVVRSFEEGVRGFDISKHGNFWGNRTRDEFLENGAFSSTDIVPGNAAQSRLVDLIERPEGDRLGMPRYRPRLHASRQAFVRQWIDAGAPDDQPPGVIGLVREPSPKPEPRPVPLLTDGPPNFEDDVRNLFRPFDRDSMIGWFDLHNYDDVKANAGPILSRLQDGTMPCTGSWPEQDIAIFARWIEGGFRRVSQRDEGGT